MVELALVMPLFIMVMVGTIALGLGVFYQQQLDNTVREAARYAAIHSATHLQCVTVGHHDPEGSNKPLTYRRCDTPQNGWRFMSAHARSYAFGIDRSAIRFSACWSGYQQNGARDALPSVDHDGDPATPPVPNTFVTCTMPGDTNGDGVADTNVDPRSAITQLPCAPAATTPANDAGSNVPNNHVTVYGCYLWTPPLAGFLLLPEVVTMRSVLTEVIHRQQ